MKERGRGGPYDVLPRRGAADDLVDVAAVLLREVVAPLLDVVVRPDALWERQGGARVGEE